MANKYVKTDNQIDAGIASIAKRGVKMQDDIHTCGCAIIRRWHDTSDVSKAVKQMNALLVAIPAMGRANAFKAWRFVGEMEEISAIEFNIGDIVRSGLVRSYLIAKTKKGIET